MDTILSSTIRDILHWLPIRQRVKFKTCILMYNCLHNFFQHVSASLCQPQPPMPMISCMRRPSSQPQKQSATALVASPSQDQLRGTRCRHHSVMTNCLVAAFRRLLKTELFTRAYDSSLARS